MHSENLGRHILVEFYNCDSSLLNDHGRIERCMNEAAVIAHATVVESVFHTFNPYGVSGAVVISESHLTIHTWPEYGYAAVDLFTCGDEVDPWPAFDYLNRELRAERTETTEIARGAIDRIKRYAHVELENVTYKPNVAL